MKLINEALSEIVARLNKLLGVEVVQKEVSNSKDDACNRLKLVLMHDRSKLAPALLEQMRDEMVEVISRYVEIDRDALDLNLEGENNSIALVANIPILRTK